MLHLERGESLKLTFAPGKNSLVQLELVEPASTSYKERADVGISSTDVKVKGNEVTVRVYSLGAINTPTTALVLKDANGRTITSAMVPSLKAPLDLVPKWTEIKMNVPLGTDLTRGSVQLDPEKKMVQITRVNDVVKW